MREYLVDSLSSEYKVVAVPDGGKALETAREINPDIIVSDIVMPVLEGDELCRILKSSVDTSHIPIILLTALSERENIIFGLEAGANDYIIKPFDRVGDGCAARRDRLYQPVGQGVPGQGYESD